MEAATEEPIPAAATVEAVKVEMAAEILPAETVVVTTADMEAMEEPVAAKEATAAASAAWLL
jgi:hypothetical protein